MEHCAIDSNYGRFGAGIYCAEGSLSLSNCTVSGGLCYMFDLYTLSDAYTATTQTLKLIEGGGIYCCSNSALTVAGGEVSANEGGGIVCVDSHAVIRETVVFSNVSGGFAISDRTVTETGNTRDESCLGYREGVGGGLVLVASTAQVENAFIHGNEACFGGGLLCLSDSVVEIAGCTVEDNFAEATTYTTLSENTTTTEMEEQTSMLGYTEDNGLGGGAAVESSRLMVSNCVFRGNRAGEGAGIAYSGGATGVIIDTTFLANSCVGGLFFHYQSSSSVAVVTYREDSALGMGGGAFFDGCSLTIDDCTFTSNTAGTGGGIAVDGAWPGAFVSNCGISNNAATDASRMDMDGGGILVRNSSCVVSNCVLAGNFGGRHTRTEFHDLISGLTDMDEQYDGRGGGILATGTSLLSVVDCELAGNTARRGGAAISIENASTGRVERCMIRGGRSTGDGRGAGICVLSAGADLDACVVWDNEATHGGGLYVTGGVLRLIHSTVCGNRANAQGGGIAASAASLSMTNAIVWNNGTSSVVMFDSATITATNSFVQGGIPGEPEGGNPELRQGYYLSRYSPCIDAAIDVGATPFDFLGNAPWDHPAVTNPAPATVRDVGGHEFVDSDGDGMDDDWERTRFSGLQQGAGTDWENDGLNDPEEYEFNTDPAMANTDGDGIDDLGEWIAGTLGADASSVFLVAAVSNRLTEGSGFVIFWESVTGRIYSVLSKSNLVEKTWQTNVTGIAGDGTTKSYTNLTDDVSAFLRLNVTKP